MTLTTEKPLNKVEIWIAEHALPIFIVLAILILLGAAAVFVTYEEQSSTAERVKVLAPQVTRVNKAICDAESLDHSDRARRCAERIRVGLINCRRVEPCRAALIAAITFPGTNEPGSTTSAPSGASGGGDAFQPSSHGHQQEGPGSQPGPAPTPSPTPISPAPTSPGNSGEHGNGNGPPATPPGQEKKSASGAGVEVCALSNCVGVEVGLGD